MRIKRGLAESIDLCQLRHNARAARPDASTFCRNGGAMGTTFTPTRRWNLARASFGPTVGYTLPMTDPSWNVEVFGRLDGAFDFGSDDIAVGAGRTFAPDEFGARLGGGIRFNRSGRVSGRISGSYDSLFREDENAWALSFGVTARH